MSFEIQAELCQQMRKVWTFQINNAKYANAKKDELLQKGFRKVSKLLWHIQVRSSPEEQKNRFGKANVKEVNAKKHSLIIQISQSCLQILAAKEAFIWNGLRENWFIKMQEPFEDHKQKFYLTNSQWW